MGGRGHGVHEEAKDVWLMNKIWGCNGQKTLIRLNSLLLVEQYEKACPPVYDVCGGDI